MRGLALEHPGGFLLALAITALLVLLAALLRPHPRPLPFYSLWEEALRGSLSHHMVPILRHLRAFLTLATLLACALIFGRPMATVDGPLDWLVIADLSYSMSVVERDGRTRLASAIEAARRWARTLPAGDRLALVAAGDPPRVVLAPGVSRRRFDRALDRLEIEAAPANLGAALELAAGAGMAPLLLSDGCAGTLPEDLDVGATHGLFFGAGAIGANRAITALRVVENWPSPPLVEARCAGFGGLDPPRKLILRDGGDRSWTWDLPVGQAALRRELPNWSGGRWSLELESGDRCAWDDQVSFDVPRLRGGGIALRAPRGGAHPALEIALGIAARNLHLALRTLAPEEVPARGEILVQDGGEVRPADLPAAGAILFGSAVSGILEPFRPAASAPTAVVLDVDRGHPISAGLPLDRLRVRSLAVGPLGSPEGRLRSLVQGAGEPLLYQLETGGGRAIGTTFDLAQSDLPGSGMLIVLLHRILIDLLRPRSPEVFFLRAGRSPGPWPRTPTDALSGGVLAGAFPTPALGIAAVLPREGEIDVAGLGKVAVNLLDERESRIEPQLPPGWTGRVPERAPLRRALGGVVAAIALVLFGLRCLLDLLLGL